MHVTLHFLGEGEVKRIAAALDVVVAPVFSLVIEKVGQFPSRDGAITLWAGVRETPELLGLHAAIAAALAGEGFRPEARRYTPHVTLARCGPEVPTSIVDEFLAKHATFSLMDVPAVTFGLYSSAIVGSVPVYQPEQSFLLAATRGGCQT
jgi:2'-5' RNA ligase